MTTTVAPKPLTRTNATKDDRIWARDSPVSDNSHPSSRGFPRLCSPPLKHITPQSTQELLENFDPLDFLDSASERSASSADTMIMMTTDEERKNAQRIRNSLLHYESNKTTLPPSPSSPRSPSLSLSSFSHINLGQSSSYFANPVVVGTPAETEGFAKRRNVPSNLVVSCHQRIGGDGEKQFNSDKPSPLDDGYGTDSRSNTSASTSSPLSSSFSSLSAFEGSLVSNHPPGIPGSSSASNVPTSPNANMHRNAIIKGQPLSSSVRGSGGGPRPVLLAAKRKEPSSVEVKDCGPNLEDRLRALTTIEEEEFSLINSSGVQDRIFVEKYLSKNSSPHSPVHPRTRFEVPLTRDRQYCAEKENLNVGDHESSKSTGCFRAVPVEIKAPPMSENQETFAKDGNIPPSRSGLMNSQEASVAPTSFTTSTHTGKDGWSDYTRYFEKHNDIPLHNLASVGYGKFVNAGGQENLPDKDINRQLGTRSVTPSKQSVTQNAKHGLSDLYGHELTDGYAYENDSGNFKLAEAGEIQSNHMDHPLAFDRKGGPSHLLMSLPDLRPHSASWGTETGPSSMPASSNQNARHATQLSNFEQGSYPTPAHPQQHNHQQHTNRYFYQGQSPCLPCDAENLHQNQLSSPERTSRDEFLSLSRSLSKQNMQMREMLQQQQQQQQQQHHHHHHHQHQHKPHQHHQQQRPENHINPQIDTTPLYSQNYPEVVLRNSNSSSSVRSLANRHDRYSWQPGTTSIHQQQYVDGGFISEPAVNQRVSLDLGSIPQLQRQIRATSEMCLQMSKRHVFASSADIYKLFQGQRKPDNRQIASVARKDSSGSSSNSTSNSNNTSNGRSQFHRHSFHSTSTRPWAGSQPILNSRLTQDEPPKSSLASSRPSLRVPSPALSNSSRISMPGPLRVDHSITIPSHAWTSVPPEMPLLMADNIDALQFQRHSSGYSSENELQQIESNAKASRKLKVVDPRSTKTVNPDQEFRPVNPSLDRGSSTTGVDDEGSSTTDNEPVYANQQMIAKARTLDSIEKPHSSSQLMTLETPSPLPPSREPIRSINNTPSLQSSSQHEHHHQYHHTSFQEHNHHHHHHQQQQQPQQRVLYTQVQPQPKITSVRQTNSFPSENPSFSQVERLTQNQIINFNIKPVTITSFVPANSYSPINGNDTDIQDNSSSSTQNNNNNNNNLAHATPFSSNVGPACETSRNGTQKIHISPRLSESSRPLRSSSSSSLQMSPVELAQMLDVPFETNIISDENGDRLSTLV